MKKKIIALSVAAVLLVMAIVGGTYAYLTDTDSAENVMTLGNVSIVQNEWERGADGNLKAFTQEKPLYPAIIPTNSAEWDWDDNAIVEFSKAPVEANGGSQKMFTEPNAVDKFITVTNDGHNDVYVRTLVAFEKGSLSDAKFDELLGISYYDVGWTIASATNATIDGKNFQIVEFVFTGRNGEAGVLAAGDTTQASLCQVYLASTATNEDCKAIDATGEGLYDIYALSQAVQAEGWTDAQTALDTAFGDVDAANIATWFAGYTAAN